MGKYNWLNPEKDKELLECPECKQKTLKEEKFTPMYSPRLPAELDYLRLQEVIEYTCQNPKCDFKGRK